MTEYIPISLNKQGQTLVVMPACRTLKTLIGTLVVSIQDQGNLVDPLSKSCLKVF